MGSRVALVTGGGRGIGAVLAARLAADGWRVAVAARTTAQIEDVARATGAFPIALDVTDADAVADSVRAVEERLGPVDLLVNNAGLSAGDGLSWEFDPATWWQVFEVNVLGAYLCARSVLPSMIRRGSGRIVNIASNAAFFAVDDADAGKVDTSYLASKAALVRMTEALAAEVRPHGVSVFAVSPGMVKTSMTEAVFRDLWDEPDIWTPPERAADLVAFLASGALDALSGRYIHAVADDWESMASRGDEIRTEDLNVLRLKR